MFSRNINCCYGGCLFAFIFTQNLRYTNSVFLPLEVISVFIKKHTWNNCFSFPECSVGKESTCNAGDPGLIPGSGRWAGEGIGYSLQQCKDCEILDFPCGSAGTESSAMQETWVWSLSWEDPLEKAKATHSSILAWRIPGLCSLWGHRIGHVWATFTYFTNPKSGLEGEL